MDTYIARQPIFNTNKQIYGYELLFRSGAAENIYDSEEADQATSHVAMESFFSRGVDAITGGKPAFVNFTSRLILENTATLFPKDKLVIEILENVEPTPEIIAACRELSALGYILALDDFVYKPELEPLIDLCKIVKIDFLSNTPQDITRTVRQLPRKGLWLLAEKIETNEMFDLAKQMGFYLFQGYFFSKPETMASKALSPLKLSYLTLLRETSQGDDMDTRHVAQAIRDDVALSYKLLRLVNSSYSSANIEVTEIIRAVSILGTVELRKWMFMIALLGLNSDKPDEIVKMSMIRGKFVESLNKKCHAAKSGESAFQTGLFSMLDVLMDMPINAALDGMTLADEVYAALVFDAGPLFDLLEIAFCFERGDWGRIDDLAALLNLSGDLLTKEYLEAVEWCNQLAI